jgi:hypothetical protein
VVRPGVMEGPRRSLYIGHCHKLHHNRFHLVILRT